VTNANETPTNIALSSATIAENAGANAMVGTLSTTDPDAANTFTYALVSGTGDTDNAAFAIDGATLKANASFDFESKSSYSVRVRSTDQGGLWTEQEFTITVTNVNDSPTDIDLSNATIAENLEGTPAIGNLTTTDEDDSEEFTYTLVSGTGDADNSAFTIDGAALRATSAFDFETQSSYSVRIRAIDQGGLWIEKIFTILITDANDAPTDINSSSTEIIENAPVNTFIGTFSTTDQDPTDTFTYTLVSGSGDNDNVQFYLDEDVLRTSATFDYESKSSYSVRIRTTDQDGLYVEKIVLISVTNQNEGPSDLTLSDTTVPKNFGANALVGTLTTTDPDIADQFTYSLVAGDGDNDNGLFNISGNRLRATDSLGFDPETSYSVRIRTTDAGGLYFDREFTIVERDLNVYVTGTSNADAISLIYQGDGAVHLWSVTVNGATVFNGELVHPGAIRIDGLGGNDSVQVAGRSVADEFVLDGNVLTLEGSTVRLTSVENLRIFGFAGDDSLRVLSGSVLFDGGTGNDQLELTSGDRQINVSGFNSGNVDGTILFANTESLQGGAGNDQFLFSSIGRLSGGLFGGDGQDSVNLAAKTTSQIINLQSGVTSVSNGFGEIEQVTASNGTGDLLIATNATNVWNIQGTNSGTLNSTLSFSGFESIAGGLAADQFLFDSAGQITGRISGGDGADVLDLSQGTAPQSYRIGVLSAVDNLVGAYTSIEQVTGNAMTGTKLIGPSSGAAWSVLPDGQISIHGANYRSIREISGGAGSDTILGPAQSNTWSILAPNAGRFESANWSIDFQGTENLYGSSGVDSFVFANDGSLSGSIVAGTGSDQLNLSAISSELLFDAAGNPKVQLVSNSQTVLGGYFSVETVTGNGLSGTKVKGSNVGTSWMVSASGQLFHNSIAYLAIGGILSGTGVDTLTGPGVSSQWSILGTNAGQLSFASSSLTFSDVENLTGGTADDSFAIAPAGALTGNLNGGTGTGLNAVSYSQWDAGISVNLASSSSGNATAIAGRTTNIQMVTGGAGNDTLIGQASKSSILVGLGGSDTLIGGTQRDLLFGGLGGDTLNGSSGDDLLVASYVSFEAQREALISIYNEWNSTRSFAQRTANILGSGTGPRSNGSYFLNSDVSDAITDTVFADGDIDSLTGGLGQDWFFADPNDSTDFSGTGTAPDKLNRPLSP
jgi:hypothetical protein